MNRKLIVWLITGLIGAGILFALLSPAPAIKKNITGPELTQLQGTGAWVVDVRTNSEYIAGHLPNSLNVPLDQLQAASSSWSKTQPIIVYCASGARSAEAATQLASLGFRTVYNLDQGIIAWKGDVVGGQASGPLAGGKGVVKTAGKPVFIDFAGSA